jgi:hypothetical protein
MKNKDVNNLQGWYICPVCNLRDIPDPHRMDTREEVRAHIQETHKDWALCKGCGELITKREYEEGKGWCELCVINCLDCMDRDKYPERP